MAKIPFKNDLRSGGANVLRLGKAIFKIDGDNFQIVFPNGLTFSTVVSRTPFQDDDVEEVIVAIIENKAFVTNKCPCCGGEKIQVRVKFKGWLKILEWCSSYHST